MRKLSCSIDLLSSAGNLISIEYGARGGTEIRNNTGLRCVSSALLRVRLMEPAMLPVACKLAGSKLTWEPGCCTYTLCWHAAGSTFSRAEGACGGLAMRCALLGVVCSRPDPACSSELLRCIISDDT